MANLARVLWSSCLCVSVVGRCRVIVKRRRVRVLKLGGIRVESVRVNASFYRLRKVGSEQQTKEGLLVLGGGSVALDGKQLLLAWRG